MSLLLARFDSRALRVASAQPLGPETPLPLPLARRLADWCHGSGLLRVAALPDTPALRSGLELFQRELDGDRALRELPSQGSRLRMRLRVKLLEALPGRSSRRDDPWDCGYLNEAAALAAFRPRRATLMVIEALPYDELQPLLALLRAQSAGYRRPLRVIVLRPPDSAALEGLERLA